jgi:DNA-directed RNA polymerase specialized sigma54-like protein
LELGLGFNVNLEGRMIRIVDAHGYGKRFIMRADEMLIAFVELRRYTRVRRKFDRVKPVSVLAVKSDESLAIYLR